MRGGEPPFTTLRRPDYCSTMSGPLGQKSEREEARARERERERAKARAREKEMVRACGQASLREQERERREAEAADWEAEDIEWEPAENRASWLPARDPGNAPSPSKTGSRGASHGGLADASQDSAVAPARHRPKVSVFDRRGRSLMSIGARLRTRRAKLLQVWAFAIYKDEYLRSTSALDGLCGIIARYLKYSAALRAYQLQLKNEANKDTQTKAARHFKGWLLRASWRGWVAYVAELYRGLEAASMSARYRALEACNTWRYCLDFNHRLQGLPVNATNPLGVNGWIARMPMGQMPPRLLENEVLRILENVVVGWLEVLEDERKTVGMRSKWRVHRMCAFFGRWMQLYCDHQEGHARFQLVGAKLLLCSRLGEWNTLAQTEAQVFRRRYELLCMGRFIKTMRQRVHDKRRIAAFVDRWLVSHAEQEKGELLGFARDIIMVWSVFSRSSKTRFKKQFDMWKMRYRLLFNAWRANVFGEHPDHGDHFLLAGADETASAAAQDPVLHSMTPHQQHDEQHHPQHHAASASHLSPKDKAKAPNRDSGEAEGGGERVQDTLNEGHGSGEVGRTGARSARPPPLDADAMLSKETEAATSWRGGEAVAGGSKRAFSVAEAVGVRESREDERGSFHEQETSPWRGWTSPGRGKAGGVGDDVNDGAVDEQAGGGGARVIERILLLLEQKSLEEEDICSPWTEERRKTDWAGAEGVGEEKGAEGTEPGVNRSEEERRRVDQGVEGMGRSTKASRAVKGLQMISEILGDLPQALSEAAAEWHSLLRDREREQEVHAATATSRPPHKRGVVGEVEIMPAHLSVLESRAPSALPVPHVGLQRMSAAERVQGSMPPKLADGNRDRSEREKTVTESGFDADAGSWEGRGEGSEVVGDGHGGGSVNDTTVQVPCQMEEAAEREYEQQCEKDILDFLLPLEVFLAHAAHGRARIKQRAEESKSQCDEAQKARDEGAGNADGGGMTLEHGTLGENAEGAEVGAGCSSNLLGRGREDRDAAQADEEAGNDQGSAGQDAKMNLEGFVRLLRGCGVVPGQLSETQSTKMFTDLTASLIPALAYPAAASAARSQGQSFASPFAGLQVSIPTPPRPTPPRPTSPRPTSLALVLLCPFHPTPTPPTPKPPTPALLGPCSPVPLATRSIWFAAFCCCDASHGIYIYIYTHTHIYVYIYTYIYIYICIYM